MRLLLVEDNELLGSGMCRGLARAGYAVDWVRSGRDVLAALAAYDYECVLLDLGLPEVSGDTLLRSIREHHVGVSVIVVTARGGVRDRVQMLDLGADDFMVKPVDLEELCARVRAVLRRGRATTPGPGEAAHGPLKLYPLRRTASWHDNLVPLTNREFWLLESFMRRKNEVLSRTQLEEALYSWGAEVESNAVEVHVHHLRRKFSPALIQTVRGIGYQLGHERQLA